MTSLGEITEGSSPQNRPPFLYEIRVKGRLSDEQWTSWFDDLSVTVDQGESTLRGKAADHAALYGLLARLRDLAIPLISVRVLDAEAQRRLVVAGRRYDLALNGLLVLLYLLLLGGFVAITVFVAPVINVALALALLLALLGALAHAFWLWSSAGAWRWIAYVTWPAAALTFLIFIPVSGLLPPALGIAIMLLLLAGGLSYVLFFMRRHPEEMKRRLVDGATGLSRLRGWAKGVRPIGQGREPGTSEQGNGSAD